MGTTPNRGYPYPSNSSSPAGPAQIQALAAAIDTDMVSSGALPDGILVTRYDPAQQTYPPQNVPTQTWTPVVGWPTQLFNPTGGIVYSGGGVFTNGFSVQILMGWYATVYWPSMSGIHQKVLNLYVNGAQVDPPLGAAGLYQENAAALPTGQHQSASGLVLLQPADTFQLWLYHSATGTAAVTPKAIGAFRAA